MESFLKEHCDVSMVLKWQNTSHFLAKFQYKLLIYIHWKNPSSDEERPRDAGAWLPWQGTYIQYANNCSI